MPYALVDIIRASTITKLGSIATDPVIPLLLFEVPYGSREEAGGDEIK
jgi:hypothetical protein